LQWSWLHRLVAGLFVLDRCTFSHVVHVRRLMKASARRVNRVIYVVQQAAAVNQRLSLLVRLLVPQRVI